MPIVTVHGRVQTRHCTSIDELSMNRAMAAERFETLTRHDRTRTRKRRNQALTNRLYFSFEFPVLVRALQSQLFLGLPPLWPTL